MKIVLYDTNKEVVNAWKKYFINEDVKVLNVSFEDLIADYVVTAGNSYGWMTGGIDLAVRNYFGQQIQDRLQGFIIERGGYLPVGELIYMETGFEDKPYLIYVPTMERPNLSFKEDVYFVACKIFRSICNDRMQSEEFENKTLAICGLCTGTGYVSAEECAEAMYKAYLDIIMGL